MWVTTLLWRRSFAVVCDQYIIVLNINTISGSCLHPE
jgi:hypothetical protein